MLKALIKSIIAIIMINIGNIAYIAFMFIIAPTITYQILFSITAIKNTFHTSSFFLVYYAAVILYIAICKLYYIIDDKRYIPSSANVVSTSKPESKIINILIFELETRYYNHIKVDFNFNGENHYVVVPGDFIIHDLEEHQEAYIEFFVHPKRGDFKRPVLHLHRLF